MNTNSANRADKRLRRVHLRRFRVEYENSPTRPARVRSHSDNYVLLQAGWDVVWDSLPADIVKCVELGNYERLSILLRVKIPRMTITVKLTISSDIVLLLRDHGMNIIFNEEPLRYSSLPDRINACVNLKNDNTQIKLTILRSDSIDPVLLECARLVRTDYVDDVSHHDTIYSYHRMLDEFQARDHKQLLFNHYVRRGYGARVILILQAGYIPEWKNLDLGIVMFLIILENLQVNEDEKFELFKYHINKCSMKHNLEYYYHPALARFWDRLGRTHLPGDDLNSDLSNIIMNGLDKSRNGTRLDQLYAAIRDHQLDLIEELIDYNQNDVNRMLSIRLSHMNNWMISSCLELVGSYISEDHRIELISRLFKSDTTLLYSTKFREYWSIIPTDNEELLQYLEYMGVELPSSISSTSVVKNSDYSLVRLRSMENNTDVILRLLDRCQSKYNNNNKSESELMILRLINDKSVLNIRDYHQNSVAQILIPYSPIYGKKNSRNCAR